MKSEAPCGAHVVGSIPLGNVEEVFRTTAAALGSHLKRLPDGELGARSNWIAWQYPILAKMEGFEEVPPTEGAYVQRPRLKASPGIASRDVYLGALGYADAARASYQVFRKLKDEGAIPDRMRFQLGLPAPIEPVIGMFTPESQEVIAPIYETQLRKELDAILEAIPAAELAIQWELVYQIGVLEGTFTVFFADPGRVIPERAGRLADLVPESIDLGYHLCYGDSGHSHFKQPDDTRIVVDLANSIMQNAGRRIDWFHMPVPKERNDEAFFEPLADLKLSDATDLYLGLVHHTDGEAGTRRRIETASRFASRFGVATECGMGRRPSDTIPELLRVHAAVSAPL